jgi:hypothetical protein
MITPRQVHSSVDQLKVHVRSDRTRPLAPTRLDRRGESDRGEGRDDQEKSYLRTFGAVQEHVSVQLGRKSRTDFSENTPSRTKS